MKIKIFVCALIFAASLITPVFSAELVVGENLKPGMPLKDAIQLLGIPESISIHRGPENDLDSLEISYASQGILIRALNNGKKVEGIELKPDFKGQFSSGVKLGDKFPTLISKYGVPNSMTSQVARYPGKEIYFLMNKDTLLYAKAFMRDTKLVHRKLMNP